MTSSKHNGERYDVVVVGAGPAGSACATILVRAGLRVVLVDRAVFPRDKICGDSINPKCWNAFNRLGVADEIAARIHNEITALTVTSARGVVLNGEPTGKRPFFSMSRAVLDDILARAADNAGAEFRDGTSVTRIERHADWHITLRDHRSGSEHCVSAPHLVGADGRNSFVARYLGRRAVRAGARRGRRGPTVKERVGAAWHTAHLPQVGSRIEMYLCDGGYFGVVNIDDERANVAMVTTPDRVGERDDFARFIRVTLHSNPVVASHLPDLAPVGEVRYTWPINPRTNRIPGDGTNSARNAGVFLIGDAGQTVEPFTGEGVFFALEDGMAAARVLVRGESRPGHRAADRFRVNRCFSPLLRTARVRDDIIAIGARLPAVRRWVVASVLS